MRSATRRNTSINAGKGRKQSVWVRAVSVWQDTVNTVGDTVSTVTSKMRRNTMHDVYDQAKIRGQEMQRSRLFMITFEYAFYLLILATIYFVLIGMPLWNGTAYWIWYALEFKLNVPGTWAIFVGIAIFYAYTPLLVLFEPDLPMPPPEYHLKPSLNPGVSDTCLLIPCYKSASIIGPTLQAATRIFPPSNIFVIANGNSPTPLDATELICQKFGVNHVWSPVGSKIVAQFVGCYAAKGFRNVLLIDDDCALPPNFPIVSDRLVGNVKCMGYSIKSVGPLSSRGSLAQQAQDMEYKLSGLQRVLAAKVGSALFPHGAISLWDREFLIQTFHQHPGFNVSEDWFFGHVARELGCRTMMCTNVFIETETPRDVFFSSGGARGGFGEMTVFKQRFTRWNFFFVNGMYYNLRYILCSWKLGWWELGTKLFCLQEIYETLLYLAMPLVVPITFYVRPLFALYMFLFTCVLYFINVAIFNEIHLRRKGERVGSLAVYIYYMPYKLVLTFVNVASCYYALFKYATYFARRHPKVIEDEKAVGVVLQLEEARDDESLLTQDEDSPLPPQPRTGRRMTVTAVGAQ
ncbi:glycosyl transferase, partial [Elsinoe ampelina]